MLIINLRILRQCVLSLSSHKIIKLPYLKVPNYLNVSMSALKPLHTFFSTIVGQRTINPADSNIIDYIGVPRHLGVPQNVSIIFFP